MSLGSYLRSLRETRQLTLRAVEKEVGISNAYLSQLETDKIRKPSPACLFTLSKLYGVPYEDLMKRAGYPLPDNQETGQAILTRTATNRGKAFRISSAKTAFSDLTEDEEESLLEYLAFLRTRKKQTTNRVYEPRGAE